MNSLVIRVDDLFDESCELSEVRSDFSLVRDREPIWIRDFREHVILVGNAEQLAVRHHMPVHQLPKLSEEVFDCYDRHCVVLQRKSLTRKINLTDFSSPFSWFSFC